MPRYVNCKKSVINSFYFIFDYISPTGKHARLITGFRIYYCFYVHKLHCKTYNKSFIKHFYAFPQDRLLVVTGCHAAARSSIVILLAVVSALNCATTCAARARVCVCVCFVLAIFSFFACPVCAFFLISALHLSRRRSSCSLEFPHFAVPRRWRSPERYAEAPAAFDQRRPPVSSGGPCTEALPA